jgi:proton glutamate symport protein
MDMARTMTNVIGNCLATAIIARWEGQLAEGPVEVSAVTAGVKGSTQVATHEGA